MNTIEQRQARAIRDATGQSYQKCLQWVRWQEAELRRATDARRALSKGEKNGERFNETVARAAVEFAREKGFGQ